MATIDLIVLGIIKQNPQSAYDIQKTVEYRNISKWVRISTPSIYKKVLQLEEKGFLQSSPLKQGNMVEKSVYSLTDEGLKEFKRLMNEVSLEPINFFLDFNAVIVNLVGLSKSEKAKYIANIKSSVSQTKKELEENIELKKGKTMVSKEGFDVLQQQYQLAVAIEKWLESC